MSKRLFGILGIGRFGQKVAKELFMRGQEVIVVDKDEARILPIKDLVTHSFIGDMTDEETLREAGIPNCDVVVIGQSSNIESNILATQLCKELGIKEVIAKAQSTLHGKILKRLQADLVVYPEQDTAVKLADKLTLKGVLDYIEVSKEFNIIEMKALDSFIDKKLKELNLRKKYNVSILAIRRGSETIMNPDADCKITWGDVLILVGNIEDLKELTSK